MSFGYSVVDFITLLQLTNAVRKRFINAPKEFKEISEEIKLFSNVLRDIDDLLPDHVLNGQQKNELTAISRGCNGVLEELQVTLNEYQALDDSVRDVNGKFRRVWKRLRWDQKVIDRFRDRIEANISAFNAYLSRFTSNATFAMKAGIDILCERQDDLERREEYQAILDWLSPVDETSQQNRFSSRRLEGTGQWMLNSEEFNEWLGKGRQVLFCPGIPGAGKTTMTSIVVHHLQSKFKADPAIGIAYTYCNYRQRVKPEAVFANLLKQLIKSHRDIPDDLQKLYDSHKSLHSSIPAHEILGILQSTIRAFSRAFIVVDGLDEIDDSYGDRRRFLSEIFDLQRKTRVSLYATSRPIPEIVTEFQNDTCLEIRASEDDISKFLDSNLSRLRPFVIRNPKLQAEIKQGIADAVDGMFLLTQLYLDSLADKTTPAALRLALKAFGAHSGKKIQALDRAYEQALERIKCQEEGLRKLAMKVLSWITYARRPLTTMELQHALAVEVGTSQLDTDNLPEIEDMISVCAGLVTVDEESNVLHFIHHTTQEYFERTCELWVPNAQSDIANVCVTYLGFDVFDTGCSLTAEDHEGRLRLNVFYEYAACNWGYHAVNFSPEMEPYILRLLGNENKVSAASQVMLATRTPRGENFAAPMKRTGAHLAAYFGLDQAMKILLKNDYRECKDQDGRTPLSLAAENGHRALSLLLLEHGDDLNLKDSQNCTPLWYSVKSGNLEMVHLLLEGGANPDGMNFHQWTALSFAAETGQEALVKLLLEKYGSQDSQDSLGRTPLCFAARNGNNTIARMLLESNVDVNSHDLDGWTPLWFATGNGHEAMVELLIEKGADITSTDFSGRTILSFAAEKRRQTTVQLLLDKGANADSEEAQRWPPLSWAAEYGDLTMAQLLLRRGANPNVKDSLKRTPMWYAIENSHYLMVELLLSQTADSVTELCGGWTTLLWAAKKGERRIVELLLQNGAHAGFRDPHGWTALSVAANYGHDTIARILIDYGADLNSMDAYGRAALSHATQNGHHKIVKLLLEAGADAKLTVSDEWTLPSFSALRCRGGASIQLLTDKEAQQHLTYRIKDSMHSTADGAQGGPLDRLTLTESSACPKRALSIDLSSISIKPSLADQRGMIGLNSSDSVHHHNKSSKTTMRASTESKASANWAESIKPLPNDTYELMQRHAMVQMEPKCVQKHVLETERRNQAAEIRKLKPCLTCRLLKKPCDNRETCVGCQQPYEVVWAAPCTRIDVGDLDYFMNEWTGDHEIYSLAPLLSPANIKHFSTVRQTLLVTHGYGHMLQITANVVELRDMQYLLASWKEPNGPMFSASTASMYAHPECISASTLSDYLDKHINEKDCFVRFIDSYYGDMPLLPGLLKTAYRYYKSAKVPVIHTALKLVLAYNLTTHITLIGDSGTQEIPDGRVDNPKSICNGKTMAPVMINYQIKCGLASLWRNLHKQVLNHLSRLFSEAYNNVNPKIWPTILVLVATLLAIWEEMQFDSHYRMRDAAAIQRFCSEMEETPLHVILGLFHTISTPLPPFLEWETRRHHRALNSNSEACSTMTAIRAHLNQHELYLRTRFQAIFSLEDFDSLANKFLVKLFL